MKSSPTMPSLASLAPFDSCVSLLDMAPAFLTVEKLIETMDRYGIAEALIHESNARGNHPRKDGNRRLLESTANEPRLHPCWVIEPPHQPGPGPANKLVDEFLAAGVRTVRLAMRSRATFLWVWQDLAAALEAHRIPCFLDFGYASTTGEMSDVDVNGVRDIALAFPNLPLILSHIMGGLGVHPATIPLLHCAPNVHLDISGIIDYWRETARDLGPERVFFATGMPFTDPSILISNIQYSEEFDEDAKRLMYGDNLRRLMEAVR